MATFATGWATTMAQPGAAIRLTSPDLSGSARADLLRQPSAWDVIGGQRKLPLNGPFTAAWERRDSPPPASSTACVAMLAVKAAPRALRRAFDSPALTLDVMEHADAVDLRRSNVGRRTSIGAGPRATLPATELLTTTPEVA